jgi:hypothetical protein
MSAPKNLKLRRKPKVRHTSIAPGKIDSSCDVQVEGKVERIVMILANARGREIVEGLWPDVQWSTDEKFGCVHSPDWLFTHIQVTRLPPHLEGATPLTFAEPDALAFAVATAVSRRAEDPTRVIFFSGYGADLRVNNYGDRPSLEPGVDVALFADYVPPGMYAATDASRSAN